MTNDVTALRNLVSPLSPTDGDGPVGLATFAGKVLDVIEKSDLTIYSKLQTKTAKQWVADERKEVLVMAFRVSNKVEMLDKISNTMFGNPWMVQTKDGGKFSMRVWLMNNTDIDWTVPLDKSK